MSAIRPLVRSTLLVAAVALASSCAVGPRYHQPAPPANAGYAPTPLPTTSAAAPVHGGEAQRLISDRDIIPFEWWRLFRSAALDELIARSFKANPTIPAAQAALAQAKEYVRAQRGFYYPNVAAGFQGERVKVAGNVTQESSLGIQGNGDNLGQPPAPASPLYYQFYTAGLSVGFVPDVFGSNRRQVESLAAQTDAQRYALEATYLTLASNVVGAAIQEASLRAQIAATRQIIAADEKSLQILRDQFSLGFAMRIDVAAQEAALAQAQTQLPPLQKQFEQTRDLIRALVGNLPNQDVAGTFELDALQLPPQLPVSVPAKLIEQRPDVRAAEAQLHAANAQVGVAVAAMLPQFSITGTLGGNADQIPALFHSGGAFWTLVGGVNQPIFAGGTLLHTQRAASAALRQAAAQYQNTVIAAYQNVADSLHACLSDAEALADAVETESAAKLTYDLTRRQMEVGYVNYLALFSAETTYNQALITRVQAEATRYGDTVALFQALGGGWWNRSEVAAK
ncbi:MAG TPA: efflux transporter outer membrane subunit [Steroidobacteraceae bacterium]|jgi:NodT family efflux transporter outer membrane factor (OMF) lipoprotein|nr:efflux transporter outer membrane subunit [Steroidobacteraceae bacterium]